MSLELDQILDTLSKITKEDESVTEVEDELFDALKNDIKRFQNSVYIATQGEFISDDHLHDLIILRDKVLNN